MQATFVLTAKTVSAVRAVVITASAAGVSRTATLNVQPWLAAFILNPTSVSGGDVTTGVVRLALPAPTAGIILVLTASDPGVTFPDGASVTVPAGATVSPTFRVQTASVATAKAVTVQAAYGTERRAVSLYISPSGPKLANLSISPSVALGGRTVVGVVTLNQAAPAGGVFVSLLSNSDSIVLPSAYLRVPAGKTSASFNINTILTGTTVTGQITATLGTAISRPLTVRGVRIAAFDLIPSSVKGGDTSIGVVTLEQASPVPITVTITSSRAEAAPETLTLIIPAGDTVGTFTINTSSVTTTVTSTLAVVANGTQKTRKLTITP